MANEVLNSTVHLTEDAPKHDRGSWSSKTEFLLSCLGYAIGIGNVWRFPYLCYRSGGGAFLVPYLLMLFFCGIPLFFMETSLGQFANIGFLPMFKIAPILKGTGYAIIIVNIIVSTYFNTIIAYPLVFLANCFDSELPWASCDHVWNTANCKELSSHSSPQRNLSETFSMQLASNNTLKTIRTPADEFFHRHILSMSDSIDDIGGIVWPLFVCNLLTWLVTYLCIIKGVKTVGKVVYFTATFPFLVLFVLFIRGITLPGASKGILFYIYPQWHQLTNLKIWADAAIQIFFSLGPGWGGIINMASYNPFGNNNKMDSITVPVMNCGTSIFAGFVVFSVIGFMSHETGLPVSTVATGGPGLAFVTYPEAISMLPWPRFWAILFFLMLFFLGLDSQFVQIEALITSIIDEYPSLRAKEMLITFITCFIMFAISTIYVTNGGMYWLQLFDWYAASISVVLICLVEVIIVGWIYGVNNFVRDIEFMIKKPVHWFWIISWKVTTPLILSFIFVTTIAFNTKVNYHGVDFPEWAIMIGWGSCLASILCIPLYIGYYLLYQETGDLIERFKGGLLASEDWGPADNRTRIIWLAQVRHKQTLDKLNCEEKLDSRHEQFIQLSSFN